MQDGDRLSDAEYSPGSNRHSRRSQGASSPLALDTKNRGIDIDDVDDDSPTLSEKDGTLYNKDGSRVEPDYRSDSPMDTTKTRNERKMSDEALKKNPLLTPVRRIVFLFRMQQKSGISTFKSRLTVFLFVAVFRDFKL